MQHPIHITIPGHGDSMLAHGAAEESLCVYTDNFYIVRLEQIKQGLRIPSPLARRTQFEIVWMKQGVLVRNTNLNQMALRANELHIVGADAIRSIESVSDDCQGFYCHFHLDTLCLLGLDKVIVDKLLAICEFMDHHTLQMNPMQSGRMGMLLYRLEEEVKQEFDLQIICTYLQALVLELHRMIHHIPTQPLTKGRMITDQFKKLLAHEVRQHHDLVHYANALKVSVNHLNKVVKQSTGKSAKRLLADMLMLEAKILLKHTEMHVTEIAYELHFSDPSHFTRFFKTQLGITPLAFRHS